MKTFFLTLAAVALVFAQGEQGEQVKRPAVGSSAPIFRLNDHNGRAVRVAPPKEGEPGHWTVLAFFPKAATPG